MVNEKKYFLLVLNSNCLTLQQIGGMSWSHHPHLTPPHLPTHTDHSNDGPASIHNKMCSVSLYKCQRCITLYDCPDIPRYHTVEHPLLLVKETGTAERMGSQFLPNPDLMTHFHSRLSRALASFMSCVRQYV